MNKKIITIITLLFLITINFQATVINAEETLYEGKLIRWEGTDFYWYVQNGERLIVVKSNNLYWDKVLESHDLQRKDAIVVDQETISTIKVGKNLAVAPNKGYALYIGDPDINPAYYVVVEADTLMEVDLDYLEGNSYDLEKFLVNLYQYSDYKEVDFDASKDMFNGTYPEIEDIELKPDLYIKDINFYPTWTKIEGIELDDPESNSIFSNVFIIAICNKGNVLTADYLSNLIIGYGENFSGITYDNYESFGGNKDFNSEECYEYKLNIDYLDTKETYKITAAIDAYNNILEEDEDNNKLVKEITITPSSNLIEENENNDDNTNEENSDDSTNDNSNDNNTENPSENSAETDTNNNEITTDNNTEGSSENPTIEITDNYNIKKIMIKNKIMHSRLKGKIMIKVEDAGKAYYVNPGSETMHYLGRPKDAFSVMREQGIGITNKDLYKIPVGVSESGTDSDGDGLPDNLENALGLDPNNTDTDGDGYSDKDELVNKFNPWGVGKQNIDDNFSGKQKGKILLQVEKKGEAWYINPNDEKRYFLGRPADAFNLMRNLGLGISNNDFDSM